MLAKFAHHSKKLPILKVIRVRKLPPVVMMKLYTKAPNQQVQNKENAINARHIRWVLITIMSVVIFAIIDKK